jgi:thymidylate synthase ThyX
MRIESKLILASKSAVTGVSLYTFVLTYPRIILPEVNTHRMLSRNTASSRAIPSRKQREKVFKDPFIPVSLGQNKKGMQAGAELSGWRRCVAQKTWEWARYPALLAAWILDKVGVHKQITNRLIEPWTWTQQIVTATDLNNVFKLRNYEDAEPHFHIIAEQMQKQVEYVERVFNTVSYDWGSHIDRRLDIHDEEEGIGAVQMLKPDEWHLPFVEAKELKSITFSQSYWAVLKNISTARCARVSYLLPENGERSNTDRDVELCGRLSSSGHWSPFEHIATPVARKEYLGNFNSWKQYRKEFAGESGGDR